VTTVRWGTFGTPVLIFATAGGDAEEIERFHVIETLAPQLEQGRIKVYSCDSIAGRAMLSREGSPEHQMWVLNQFQEFLYHEMVPAIRADCRTPDIEIVAAGSSIGAFSALAAICRYPDVFRRALCMSGTYDMQRFLQGPVTQDLYFSSPLHYLESLQGEPLAKLRTRSVLLASGEGEAEDIAESWRVADLLGRKGIANRVDSWGPEWHHDWPLWRNMLHAYIDELVREEG
jgi:esterase/lipase superfamily enzyme